MKKIDLSVYNKYKNIVVNYNKYFKFASWLPVFTTNPLEVISYIEKEFKDELEKFDNVIAGIDNTALKTQAVSIGLKVINDIIKETSKSIKDDIDFIFNKENCIFKTIEENATALDSVRDVDSLKLRIKHINSTLAYKEFAEKRIPMVVDEFFKSDLDSKAIYTAINTCVLQTSGRINDEVELSIKDFTEIAAYISGKIKVIKENIVNDELVVSKPEIELKDLEITNELKTKLLDYLEIDDSSDETYKQLTEEIINHINVELPYYLKITEQNKNFRLDKNILLSDLSFLDSKKDEFLNNELVAKEYSKFVKEYYNLHLISIDSLSKIIDAIYDNANRLNSNVNLFTLLNELIEIILTKVVIGKE